MLCIVETTARANWALAQANGSLINAYIFQVHFDVNVNEEKYRCKSEKKVLN